MNVIVCGNRFGKTAGIIAVRHIWHCFYKIGMNEGEGASWQKADYRTAALAPFSDTAEVDYRIIYQIMTSSFEIQKEGEPLKTNRCAITWYLDKERCRNSHPFFIAFKDNAGIRFFTGSEDKFSAVQGKKFGYGSYDEGGRSHHLEYELKSNLLPRFSEMAAPLDLVSTPDQRSPSLVFHHDIFLKGQRNEDGYTAFEGSAYENIYLPKHHFERLEQSLKGDPLYDQVIYGKFVFSGDTFFKAEDIQKAITEDLNGGERWKPGYKYVLSTDTAVGADEQVDTVVHVPEGFDIKKEFSPHLRVVRQTGFKGSSKSPALAMQEHIDLWEAYDKEPNAVSGVLETFSEGSVRWYYDLPDTMRRKTRPYGSALQTKGMKAVAKVTTNGGKKVDMLLALRKCLTMGLIDIPEDNKELIQQLTMYREKDERLATDRIISLALACWYVLEGKPANTVARAQSINW